MPRCKKNRPGPSWPVFFVVAAGSGLSHPGYATRPAASGTRRAAHWGCPLPSKVKLAGPPHLTQVKVEMASAGETDPL